MSRSRSKEQLICFMIFSPVWSSEKLFFMKTRWSLCKIVCFRSFTNRSKRFCDWFVECVCASWYMCKWFLSACGRRRKCEDPLSFDSLECRRWEGGNIYIAGRWVSLYAMLGGGAQQVLFQRSDSGITNCKHMLFLKRDKSEKSDKIIVKRTEVSE